MAETHALPIIDLSMAGPSRDLVARQLVDALKTKGFLYIDNVPGLDLATLFEDTKWFFSLPSHVINSTTRKLWNPSSSNYYRGYFPLQPEAVSFKEGFEICDELSEEDGKQNEVHPFFLERNLWPRGIDGAERFQTNMENHYTAFFNASSEILRLLCRGLGVDESWFEPMFSPNSLSTLRMIHYPPRPGPPPPEAIDDGQILCCSEHADSGFVTLLATFNFRGLQIRKETGDWFDVPSRPNGLVMNIGQLLSDMSCGQLKATKHRVVQTGVDRYSVPFFFEPRFDADIKRVLPIWPIAKAEIPAGSTKYGPWVLERMLQFAEFTEMLALYNARADE